METVAYPGVDRTDRFEPTVHGLRGVAALGIYIYHVYDMMRKQNVFDAKVLPPIEKLMIISLSSGVDLFFMISGYLITGSLIRHANIRQFMLDRVARLYPLFLFLHILLFAVAPMLHYKWTVGLTPGEWAFHFLTNLFMLPGMFKLPLMQLNAWTLSYEWCFYLVSAATYFSVARNIKLLRWVILLVVVPALLYFYPRAVFFLAGVLIYFANARKIETPRILDNAAVSIVAPILFAGLIGYGLAFGVHWAPYAAFIPGLIVFAKVSRNAPSYKAILGSRPMQFMGTISYSFYLWHAVVTFPLKGIAAHILSQKFHLPSMVTVVLFGTVSFVITIGVSYLSYLYLEKFATRWLKDRFRGKPFAGLAIRPRKLKVRL